MGMFGSRLCVCRTPTEAEAGNNRWDGQGVVDSQARLTASLVLTHTAADPLRNDVMWGFSLFVVSVARICSLLALIPQASGINGDNMF